MTTIAPTVNTVAPLANVSICMSALKRAQHRQGHLPGMITFYGPAGWGKTVASAYVANKFGAYYVQCMSSMTKKALLQTVLREMEMEDSGTLTEMTYRIAEQLVVSQRPLLIDEVDHLVDRKGDKKTVEIIRDIYEASSAAIILIGEEQLPDKLRRVSERFHSRMLDWVQAQPASLDDALHLQKLYLPDLSIDKELLKRVTEVAKGSARRIVVNMDRISEFARAEGLKKVTLSDWGDRPLFTGEAPRRKV